MNDKRNVSWTGTHPLEALYNAALARAEAAEEEHTVLLENILSALGVDHSDIDEAYLEQTAMGVIAAIRARVAELEAAQQWRPVTDTVPAPMQHVVINTRDGADVGWRLTELPHLWQTRRGRSYIVEEVQGWLELPAPEAA